jgi:hypothetical protein
MSLNLFKRDSDMLNEHFHDNLQTDTYEIVTLYSITYKTVMKCKALLFRIELISTDN